jgi:CRP-like cAMP-binding protein
MIDAPQSVLITADKNTYLKLPSTWDGLVLIESGIGLVELFPCTPYSELIGVQIVKPGQWVGTACVYSQPETVWSIRAITYVMARYVPRVAYQQYLESLSPPVRDRSIKTALVDVSNLLHASYKTLSMVRNIPSDKRVLWAVTQLADAIRATTGERDPVVKVARDVLSSIAITTPETVSRSINALAAKGLLEQIPPRGLRLVRTTAT